jgi:hypothetical protein
MGDLGEGMSGEAGPAFDLNPCNAKNGGSRLESIESSETQGP